MKSIRRVSMAVAAAACIFAAGATERVYTPECLVTPGETYELPIWVDLETNYIGMQVDVALPQGMEFVFDEDNEAIITLNQTAVKDHVSASGISPTGSLTIVVFSMKNSKFPLGNHEFITVRVKVSESFKGTATGELLEPVFSTVESEEADFAPSNFTVAVKLTALDFSRQAIELKEGREEELTLTYTPASAFGIPMEYTSSDPSIAVWELGTEAGQAGTLKALKPGTATISATAQGQTATVEVTVLDKATGIESVSETETFDVYDINGYIILKDADKSSLTELAKGLYILRSQGHAVRIVK